MSLFATRVERYASIGSTMDRARELAETDAPEGTLIEADEQTTGRGTGGRRWLTPPGTQLAFSLLVRPTLERERLARLTMWVGLALRSAVQAYVTVPAPVQLKWPNDLLLDGRKVAGILVEGAFTESRLRYAVIGVGLNVSAAPPDDAVEFPATCLARHASAPVDRDALRKTVLDALAAGYPSRLFDPGLVAEWRAALWWPTGAMRVTGGGEEVVGRLAGVTEAGALILETAAGPRTLETGRLRPMAGDPYNAAEGGPPDV